MQNWEYLTIQLHSCERKYNPQYYTQQLNHYGAMGWELVSCFCTNSYIALGAGGGTEDIFAMFKRAAPSYPSNNPQIAHPSPQPKNHKNRP